MYGIGVPVITVKMHKKSAITKKMHHLHQFFVVTVTEMVQNRRSFFFFYDFSFKTLELTKIKKI